MDGWMDIEWMGEWVGGCWMDGWKDGCPYFHVCREMVHEPMDPAGPRDPMLKTSVLDDSDLFYCISGVS